MPEHRTTCASLATRPHALEIWSVVGNAEVRDLANARHAKQVRIWVNPDQLTNLGLTVSDLNTAVQQQSAVSTAGQIGGPHQKGQQFTYSVRAPRPR
jgi:multidrug efflux pump subunit AcrB